MIKVGGSIEISSPQSQVFTFISDLNNIPRWQSEVVQSTVVTPGPLKVGTRFDEVVKVGPWRLHNHCVVTQYEPERRMAFKAESSPVEFEGKITLEQIKDKTLVTMDGTASLKGFYRMMQFALASDLRKGVRQELRALKEILETR